MSDIYCVPSPPPKKFTLYSNLMRCDCSTTAIDVLFRITLPLQLKSCIRRSGAFTGFDEHPISFLPLGALCLSVMAPTDSFYRTYRFATNMPTDAAGYDIKYLPSPCLIVSVIYLLYTPDANQPGRIVYYTNLPLLSQSARGLTMRIHGSP